MNLSKITVNRNLLKIRISNFNLFNLHFNKFNLLNNIYNLIIKTCLHNNIIKKKNQKKRKKDQGIIIENYIFRPKSSVVENIEIMAKKREERRLKMDNLKNDKA